MGIQPQASWFLITMQNTGGIIHLIQTRYVKKTLLVPNTLDIEGYIGTENSSHVWEKVKDAST